MLSFSIFLWRVGREKYDPSFQKMGDTASLTDNGITGRQTMAPQYGTQESALLENP
jgi:hypothetical protein